MNYGFHLSAAGALTSLHRQDLLANNLANMNTVGFKADAIDARQRLPERLESPGSFADPQWLLERLGGGTFLEPTRIAFRQGNLVSTSSPLDLAIQGDGFFAVEGGDGPQDLRLTRDGSFTMNERGVLVTAADGRRVLGETRAPIRLDRSMPVEIDATGAVFQNGAEVARLRFVGVRDMSSLRKVGGNLFRLVDGAVPDRGRPSGHMLQGYTEAGAVDPVLTLNDMMNAAKAAKSNLLMMQYQDNVLGQAINTFGRVA